MKAIYFILFYLIVIPVTAQIIQGYVRDKSTGEILAGATVTSDFSQVATFTNAYGYFSIKVPIKSTLTFTYVGYSPFQLYVEQAQRTTIMLNPIVTEFDEITVRKDKNDQGSSHYLEIQKLKKVPMLLGEPDVIKSLTTLPGIQNGREGSSSLIIRGGGQDQNLLLLDEAPVYNLNHLFGLTSSFNPDAVHSVSVYKSAFPAEYGGRLSSVVDIKLKEGNKEKQQSSFSVGLLSSRFMTEGPLLREKKKISGSYLLSGRASYLGLFLLPSYLAYKGNKKETHSNYWLGDVNGKLNVQFGENGQLMASFFRSQDNYKGLGNEGSQEIRNDLKWSNQTFTLRYIHALGQRFFTKTVAIQSAYQSLFGIEEMYDDINDTKFFSAESGLKEMSLKQGFEWFYNANLQINFGTEINKIRFSPSFLTSSLSYSPQFLARINSVQIQNKLIFYGETKWQYKKWNSSIGYRFTDLLGDDLEDKGHEPRLSVGFSPTMRQRWTMNFTAGKQFLHLLNGNTTGLSNDIWIPATNQAPPQQIKHFDLGFFTKVNENLTLQSNIYYKEYRNLADYSIRSSFLTNFSKPYFENIVTNGKGYSSGLELALNYEWSRLSGWSSITLAKNRTQFTTINEGQWYPSYFDRPLSFSSVWTYSPTKKHEFTGNFSLHSGDPITLPTSIFPTYQGSSRSALDGITTLGRNQSRMPVYHRLDVSYSKHYFNGIDVEKTLTVGFYNVYNRRNPFFIDDRQSYGFTNNQATSFTGRLVGVSIFTILPYISFTRKIK